MIVAKPIIAMRSGLLALVAACAIFVGRSCAAEPGALVNACRNDPRSERNQAAKKVNFDDVENEAPPEDVAMLSSWRPGEFSYYYDPEDRRSKGRERSLFFTT